MSFEYLDAPFRCFESITILVIYRPPNHPSFDLLFGKFSNLIEQISISPGDILIIGDFNFHIDDEENLHSRRSYQPTPPLESLQGCNAGVVQTPLTCNLRVVLDRCFNL